MASQNIDPMAMTSRSANAKDVEGVSVRQKDNHSVSKRLQQELMDLMMSCPVGVSAFPDGDNLFKWRGTINGAEGTVYEGLTYQLSLEFQEGYPCTPPVVKFATPCFHPNVDQHGNICLDILKDKWSPSMDVKTLLLSLQSLLADANISSPLNSHAAELWPNREAYKQYLHEQYKRDTAASEGGGAAAGSSRP